MEMMSVETDKNVPARRKRLSARAFRNLIRVVAVVFFVGGIVLGAVFKKPDSDLEGRPIMVFDFWLTLCVWLSGLIIVALLKGREINRK
jgi:uncharacterized membrane protein